MISARVQPSGPELASSGSSRRDDDLGTQFEALARRLHAALKRPDQPSCLIGVTSCARAEGVSTVAHNLAAYATHVVGCSVLLLEANVDHPSAAERLGVPVAPGLVEGLAKPDRWNDCLHRSPVSNVWVMPAGRGTAKTRHMANLAGLDQLLESLRNRFPFIVVDLPPATESVFGLAVAECLDGVLLVLEAERMRVQVVERAKQLFEQSQVNLLGAVLNKRRMHIPGWLYRRL
jgi:Mrp family chromosome partitioning ATPase